MAAPGNLFLRPTAAVAGIVSQSSTNYDDNRNRLDDGAVYDAQDRQLERAGVRYTYAPDGQLERRTDASGQRTFGYDAAGQLTRVRLKTVDVLTKQTLWSFQTLERTTDQVTATKKEALVTSSRPYLRAIADAGRPAAQDDGP